MPSARMDTLARLQGQIDCIEGGVPAGDPARVPLGHGGADAALGGGLVRGALHEVYAADGWQQGAATGFVLGLVHRLTDNRRAVLWVRQDFAAQEAGELSMSGFAELGLDPRRLFVVHASDAQTALRAAADALACDAFGAVVAEICGETRAFDLAVSRRLTLAAAQSRVTALMLRMNALAQPSAAETRWIVRTAHSPPVADWEAWGAPMFDVELARNRHGPTGRWIMEWQCDDTLFRERTAHSQPAIAVALHGSHPAPRRRDTNSARRAG